MPHGRARRPVPDSATGAARGSRVVAQNARRFEGNEVSPKAPRGAHRFPRYRALAAGAALKALVPGQRATKLREARADRGGRAMVEVEGRIELNDDGGLDDAETVAIGEGCDRHA